MLKKLAIAVFAIGLSAPAMAQYVMSDDMKGFFNSDGSMKAEADVTTMYGGLSAEQQAKLKEECQTQKGSTGATHNQESFCNWLAKMN